jgi:hypothetical protein
VPPAGRGSTSVAGEPTDDDRPSGRLGDKNELLPGISVLIQDSLLAHARVQIDF